MEKRMAGDYEVIHAFHIGDKEIVIGENVNAPGDERYMCAFCEKNEILGLYSDLWVSDDFCEIAKIYADRLSEQTKKTRPVTLKSKFQDIDTNPPTKINCILMIADDNITEKCSVML